MAEGKVIGKLTNIVNFSTDKASLARVLKDIKKVKDEMKGLGPQVRHAALLDAKRHGSRSPGCPAQA